MKPCKEYKEVKRCKEIEIKKALRKAFKYA